MFEKSEISVQQRQDFFEEEYFDQADYLAIEDRKMKRTGSEKKQNKNEKRGKSHTVAYLANRTSK